MNPSQQFLIVCAAAILSPFAVCLMVKSYVEWRVNRWARRTMR